MSKSQNVIYEPHPVTPERKAELRAQDLRIIDIQFKPAEVESRDKVPYDYGDEPAATEAPAKRGRKAKTE